MKDKIIKYLPVICLVIPFFIFNPIFASQKAEVTFDNDNYLESVAADIYEIGTYSLDSKGVPTVTLEGAFEGKFTEDLTLTETSTINFVNRCSEVILNDNNVLPITSVTASKSGNGVFDTEIGKVYLALVKTAGQTKADIVSKDNNYMTIIEHQYFTYEFTPMLYLDGACLDTDPNPLIPCKFARIPKAGELVIEKTLTSYRKSKPVTFAFKITKIKEVDGSEVNEELDVVALTFSEAGKKKLLVENVPVGATVKVEEIYSGAGYTITGSNVATTLIKHESKNKGQSTYEESKVSFVNDFNDQNEKGYGVSNTFEKSASGWQYKGKDLETGGTNE